ncbi:MAG: tRNA-dihydrouridine synthase family protein [archaeon]
MSYFKIGKVVIRGKGILAPIADYSTLPFRLLCREYGCSLLHTEMLHINYLLNHDINDISLLETCSKDNPLSVQLVGNFTNRKLTLDACNLISANKKFGKIIDLNLGCPASRIIGSNSGSALLKDIDKIIPIIKEIKQTINKPLTVKTRLGFNKNEIEKISNKLISTGIDALTIHGRLATNGYNIKSNIKEVYNIKENYQIPIIYNGDINSSSLNEILQYDFAGFMVARAAIKDPRIFSEINNYFSNKKANYNLQDKDEKQKIIKKFLKIENKYQIKLNKLKLILLSLFSEKCGAKLIRTKICCTKTRDELLSYVHSII